MSRRNYDGANKINNGQRNSILINEPNSNNNNPNNVRTNNTNSNSNNSASRPNNSYTRINNGKNFSI